VPVPECVTGALEALGEAHGELLPRLAAHLAMTYRVEVSEDDLAGIALPVHLRLRYRIVDDQGRELADGRELLALRAQLAEAARLDLRPRRPRWRPARHRTQRHPHLGPRRPAGGDRLQPWRSPTHRLSGAGRRGETVALRLFDTAAAAAASHRGGVCRLLRLELRDAFRQWRRACRGSRRWPCRRTRCDADSLREDWLSAVADRALLGNTGHRAPSGPSTSRSSVAVADCRRWWRRWGASPPPASANGRRSRRH
jgi:ATP-dependent helicase HrpA